LVQNVVRFRFKSKLANLNWDNKFDNSNVESRFHADERNVQSLLNIKLMK